MQTRLKVSIGGTLVLLAMMFGIVAAEVIAYLNTTTTTLLGLYTTLGFFMILTLVLGFIGFYLFSEIVLDSSQ